MGFDSDIASVVEVHMKHMVRGIKGVRDIKRRSLHDLGVYRISFGYQRKGAMKYFLLIHNPEQERFTFCAEWGFGSTPENVRKQLLNKIGMENYRMKPQAHLWTDVSTDDLCNNHIFPYKWMPRK
jgi:hypothetical protein